MKRFFLALLVLAVALLALPPLFYAFVPEELSELPPPGRRVAVGGGISVNVVERPTRRGGRGISIIGQHEIVVPLLAAGVLEAAGRRSKTRKPSARKPGRAAGSAGKKAPRKR